jgi:hypothetical protein
MAISGAMNDVFPYLAKEGYTATSPSTPQYNCIAWAAGQTHVCWWPDEMEVAFWPAGVPRAVTPEVFFKAFQSIGYFSCADGSLEAGFEKVAFYVLNGKPTHAARQLPDGRWTSKLGKWLDVSHTLHGVEGPVYGQAAGFMKRQRTSGVVV